MQARLLHRRSCNAPASATLNCWRSLIFRWCMNYPASAKSSGSRRCICNTSAKNRFPSALQWWNQPRIGAEWLFGGTGVGASNHFEAGGFIRSREEFAWPNIQYHFLPVAINYNGSNAVKEHGFNAMSDRCARRAVGMCGLNPATRTSIREFCLTTCRFTSRTGRSSATQFASPRDHASTRAGSIPWPRNQPRCRMPDDEQLDEVRA